MSTYINTLLQSMDFSDIEEDIVNVSEKYFKYWLMEYSRVYSIDTTNISYDKKALVDDFKKELVDAVTLWDPEDDPRKNDIRFVKWSFAGGLDQLWSDKYLVPLGEKTEQSSNFYMPMSSCIDSKIFIKFIERNKGKIPVRKKSRRSFWFTIRIFFFKVKHFLTHGEWIWWVR